MARIKVRRTNREELPGVALLRDSVAEKSSTKRLVLDLDMELDPTLEHLMSHDPDGFLCALDKDETLGFAAAHVRSRQWTLSELWVLTQHQGRGAGEALVQRSLTYGERSGVRSFLAVVPVTGDAQAILLRQGFRHLAPLYIFQLTPEVAEEIGPALARLLPGQDVTGELLERRGQANVDRIDQAVRGSTRQVDHLFWLKKCNLNVSFVRQVDRVAAYAYGGKNQVGPVAGSTQDAALAGLGWAVRAAVAGGAEGALEVRIPAPFTPAVEALLEGGARLVRTLAMYGRGSLPAFDRYVAGAPNLP